MGIFRDKELLEGTLFDFSDSGVFRVTQKDFSSDMFKTQGGGTADPSTLSRVQSVSAFFWMNSITKTICSCTYCTKLHYVQNSIFTKTHWAPSSWSTVSHNMQICALLCKILVVLVLLLVFPLPVRKACGQCQVHSASSAKWHIQVSAAFT